MGAENPKKPKEPEQARAKPRLSCAKLAAPAPPEEDTRPPEPLGKR